MTLEWSLSRLGYVGLLVILAFLSRPVTLAVEDTVLYLLLAEVSAHPQLQAAPSCNSWHIENFL